MTERLHFHFSFSCIGEGNGNPLQCSCLENPRDGGAWWAAVCGVAQSRTRLKQLSSKDKIATNWLKCHKNNVMVMMLKWFGVKSSQHSQHLKYICNSFYVLHSLKRIPNKLNQIEKHSWELTEFKKISKRSDWVATWSSVFVVAS